jgi:DnaK suppressor protein
MAENQRSALTAEQVTELRAELERELARLDRTMESSREAAKPVMLDQTSVGRVSRVDALQNQAMSVDLHARNEARRAQIVDALERISAGTYGICARCSQPIPYGRLLVFPEARSCATCGAREG